jgi:uncharacterized protein (DUF2147 family)
MQGHFALTFLAVLVCSSSTVASELAMSGTWARGDGAARVRIGPCGGSVCAINTWIKNPAGGEKVGDRLVMTLKPKSPSVMSGTAYDPQRGMTYAIEVRIAAGGMTTRGCVLGGIVCKSVAWAKLN